MQLASKFYADAKNLHPYFSLLYFWPTSISGLPKVIFLAVAEGEGEGGKTSALEVEAEGEAEGLVFCI